MYTVVVDVVGKDKFVGAMVKAIAVQVAGYPVVSGASGDYLETTGYFEFPFPNPESVERFRSALRRYLPGCLASAR